MMLWEYKGKVNVAGQATYHFVPYKTKSGAAMYMTMEHMMANSQHFRPFCIDTEELT
jgi:hypothetical protein